MLALPFASILIASAAVANAGAFTADLQPVPHDQAADGGSEVTGTANLRLNGRNLVVDLVASGLTPGEPHAMHLHGVLGAANECPGIEVDRNTGDPIDPDGYVGGEPDGLISLGEGAPDYGPIDVSFTGTGDTSPASGLSLERFVATDSEGDLSYQRTIKGLPGRRQGPLQPAHRDPRRRPALRQRLQLAVEPVRGNPAGSLRRDRVTRGRSRAAS